MQNHIQDDKRANVLVANIICAVIAVVAVALRFVARRMRYAALELDDYLMLSGMVGKFSVELPLSN